MGTEAGAAAKQFLLRGERKEKKEIERKKPIFCTDGWFLGS